MRNFMYDTERSHWFWKTCGDEIVESMFFEEPAWEDLYALEEVGYSFLDCVTWEAYNNSKEFFEKVGYPSNYPEIMKKKK